MSRVHWLGTGLSSIPGLRRLLKKNYNVFVWNRTIKKAQTLLGDLTNNIYKFDFSELEKKNCSWRYININASSKSSFGHR